jgi:superfamily II DNA or RNA helicase
LGDPALRQGGGVSALDYRGFLARKVTLDPPSGLAHVPPLPRSLKPFQRDIVSWALHRGRAAIFAGTGLGKTLQQLCWAQEVHRHTQGPVLIFTPLAVAQQTVAEAAKFCIPGVEYAKDAGDISSPITVTNYDRLDRFDPREFAGVVLDESSIIKSHDSKTRVALIDACAETPWRLACTATPAPNDYVELGNHAEFLGVMREKEMLAMFFVHDGSVRAGGGAEWRLKRHAERDFWQWLASWAVMIRSPADLGYDDPQYILPPLIKHPVTVPVEYKPQPYGTLFPMEACTLSERIAAKRESIEARVIAAAAIVNAKPDRPWLIWCRLNDEADAIERAIPGAVQVTGSDDRDTKAARLLGFCSGSPRVLVSKPSIAGFGMNWQHCADMVFVGMDDSFESLFQAIRRCWRFGQSRPVNVYLIASELEGAVVENIAAKERDFERMCDEMAGHMKELTQRAVRGGRLATEDYHAIEPMKVPEWMA